MRPAHPGLRRYLDLTAASKRMHRADVLARRAERQAHALPDPERTEFHPKTPATLALQHEGQRLGGQIAGVRAGRQGGRSTSDAKVQAARVNGILGGRPRGRGNQDARPCVCGHYSLRHRKLPYQTATITHYCMGGKNAEDDCACQRYRRIDDPVEDSTPPATLRQELELLIARELRAIPTRSPKRTRTYPYRLQDVERLADVVLDRKSVV